MGYAGFQMGLTLAGKTIGKAQNVDLDASAGEVELTTRDSEGWKEFIQGLKEWTLSGDQLWVPSDEGVLVIRDSFLTGAVLAAIITDPSGNGFSGNLIITTFKNPQPLDGAVTSPFTARGTGALTPLSVS